MAQVNGVRLTAHQRTWLERIKACEAAGMTMSAYAAEHGFDARTMYGANKVLKRKGVLPGTDRPARFQRAQIIARDFDELSVRIPLPNGVTVSLSGPLDADSLSSVLAAAAALR
jgi:hypothetical protein